MNTWHRWPCTHSVQCTMSTWHRWPCTLITCNLINFDQNPTHPTLHQRRFGLPFPLNSKVIYSMWHSEHCDLSRKWAFRYKNRPTLVCYLTCFCSSPTRGPRPGPDCCVPPQMPHSWPRQRQCTVHWAGQYNRGDSIHWAGQRVQ